MCSSDDDEDADDESNDDRTVSSLLTRQFSVLYILNLFTALNPYPLSAALFHGGPWRGTSMQAGQRQRQNEQKAAR
jgi:hypothetical protein